MPTSITKYQISSDQVKVTPASLPDLSSLSAPSTPREVQKTIVTPLPVADNSKNLVHASLLDSPPPSPKSSLLPSLFDRLKENPFTQPIPSDTPTHNPSLWKTHVGIAIISFFLGASVAIILMLYLY